MKLKVGDRVIERKGIGLSLFQGNHPPFGTPKVGIIVRIGDRDREQFAWYVQWEGFSRNPYGYREDELDKVEDPNDLMKEIL